MENMDIIIATFKALGLPKPIPEYKFHPARKWKADYAWPEKRIALEKEGGVYKKGKDGQRGGRHNRPQGFINDMKKYNALTEMGWKLFRYLPNKIDYDQIIRVYKNA
jgi:hypothetical protein